MLVLLDIALNLSHAMFESLIGYFRSQYTQVIHNLTDFTSPGYIWLYVFIWI